MQKLSVQPTRKMMFEEAGFTQKMLDRGCVCTRNDWTSDSTSDWRLETDFNRRLLHSHKTKIWKLVFIKFRESDLKSRDLRDPKQNGMPKLDTETILHPLRWQTRVPSGV